MSEISNPDSKESDSRECVICYLLSVNPDDQVTCGVCSHAVCSDCYRQLRSLLCPMCRTRYPSGDHPTLGNSNFHLIMMKLLLLHEQRRLLNQCRIIWQLHLHYLRSKVGLGDLSIMIMIGETDILLARVQVTIGDADRSIEDLYTQLLSNELRGNQSQSD